MATKALEAIWTEVKMQSWKESARIYFEPAVAVFKFFKFLALQIFKALDN